MVRGPVAVTAAPGLVNYTSWKWALRPEGKAISNPFSQITVSNWNATPPSDDGSQTTANQVTWAGIKTKLSEPLKTAIESLNTNVNTAFATVDDASKLTTGTLPDARLSSNVPLIDGTNAFTGTNTFDGVNVTDFARMSLTNTFTGAAQILSTISPEVRFVETDAAADNKIWWLKAAAEQFSLVISNDDFDVFGNVFVVTRTDAVVDTVNFEDGELQYGGVEVGFRDTPINSQAGDYTLVLTDRGKTIYKASGGGSETITIPANSSVAFDVGTQIDIVNQGGGDLSIAITTDTLTLAGAGTTGTRTLADDGWATIKKVASTSWVISGVGLT